MTKQEELEARIAEAQSEGKQLCFLETERHDRLFWEDVITNFAFHAKLEFNIASKMDKKDGVTEVIKYLGFTPEFYEQNSVIFCIDSDSRYVLQDSLTQGKKYVFQTYSYSIENHKCISQNLNRLIRIFDIPFDFTVFLKKYAEIIYPVLLYWIDCLRKNKEEQASEKLLKPLLSIRPSDQIYLPNHAEEELVLLQIQVENWQKTLSHEIDFQDLSSYAHNLGIKPEDSFLYINGHILYDNVITQLLEKMKIETRKKRINELPNETDKEKKQKKDKIGEIDNFFEKESNYKTLLNYNYRDCLHSNHCFLMERIRQDVKQYFG